MRAVVESRRLSQLEGVNASGVAAGALGAFECPRRPVRGSAPAHPEPTGPDQHPQLHDPSRGGHHCGRGSSLSNISIAFVAGLAIGILQNILTLALPSSSSLASSFRQQALPFILLAGVLLFNKSLRRIEQSSDLSHRSIRRHHLRLRRFVTDVSSFRPNGVGARCSSRSSSRRSPGCHPTGSSGCSG